MAAGNTKGTVGVIGLGIMGGAFAKNLSKAGWRVVGYDISATARRAAARLGVKIAGSAADLAAQVPVILTSLPKPAALMATARAIAAANSVLRTAMLNSAPCGFTCCSLTPSAAATPATAAI